MGERANIGLTEDAPRTTRRPLSRAPAAPVRHRHGRDVIEIEEVERLGVRPTRSEVVRKRAWNILLPTVLGMVIDGGDLFTSMMTIAFPLGCVIGFVWAGFLDVPPTWRLVITVLTGAYLVAPFTTMVPVATLVAVIVQVFHPKALQREPFA